MGTKKRKYVILLICALFVTGLLIHAPNESTTTTSKPQTLKQVFGSLDGYKLISSSPLEPGIVEFLELDDYIQNRYEKDGKIIDFYIGYYNSLDKVSSAHSPLVCFPGQGWVIDNQSKNQMIFADKVINQEEFITTLGDYQQLVLYWYQATNKTTPQIYKNKINAVINSLANNNAEHAFVRVSVPLEDLSTKIARQLGQDFIATMYPVFLDYINSSLKKEVVTKN